MPPLPNMQTQYLNADKHGTDIEVRQTGKFRHIQGSSSSSSIKFLNTKNRLEDGKLMKPKEARTRMDMSNEFYDFLISQVEKLQLKLPESATQDMFDSLNS